MECFTANAIDSEGCGNGRDGYERLSVRQFDLVVLDIGLPDISGYELFHKIRALGRIPVLFLTQRNTTADAVACLELGAVDFVPKPLNEPVLLARIRKALREKGQGSSNEEASAANIRIEGDLRLDSSQRTIHFKGVCLKLTRIEFEIFACLILRPRNVFSRTQLLEAAWADKVGSMDRTIDCHIRSIRSKLKKIHSDQALIKTHHGLGYAFEP